MLLILKLHPNSNLHGERLCQRQQFLKWPRPASEVSQLLLAPMAKGSSVPEERNMFIARNKKRLQFLTVLLVATVAMIMLLPVSPAN